MAARGREYGGADAIFEQGRQQIRPTGAETVGAEEQEPEAGADPHQDPILHFTVALVPTALWRRCVLLIFRWLLAFNILLLAHVAFRIGQPIEELGRNLDLLSCGTDHTIYPGLDFFVLQPDAAPIHGERFPTGCYPGLWA